MSQAPPPRSTAFHSLLHLPRRIRRTLCSRYYDDSVFSSLGSRNPSGGIPCILHYLVWFGDTCSWPCLFAQRNAVVTAEITAARRLRRLLSAGTFRTASILPIDVGTGLQPVADTAAAPLTSSDASDGQAQDGQPSPLVDVGADFPLSVSDSLLAGDVADVTLPSGVNDNTPFWAPEGIGGAATTTACGVSVGSYRGMAPQQPWHDHGPTPALNSRLARGNFPPSSSAPLHPMTDAAARLRLNS